jgi:hypothetical protein
MTKIIQRDLIKHLEWQPGQATVPKARSANPVANSQQNVSFPDSPAESFIMSYDGPHGEYFQELIAKVNEKFHGTRAEIPTGTNGEIKNMYPIKRMALISTIYDNPNLQNQDFWPITPMQDEYLLKEGKLPHPNKYWEDLGLILYDMNGSNSKEAQALREEIVQHKSDLRLSESDLEEKLIIVNAGGEIDQNMPRGVRPIIVPNITQVYTHEILNKIGENHKFEYGLEGGLPRIDETGKGKRTIYMPNGNDIGLRVLCRDWGLGLDAGFDYLAYSSGIGRVNFARSASP